jgi:hypothetical protein
MVMILRLLRLKFHRLLEMFKRRLALAHGEQGRAPAPVPVRAGGCGRGVKQFKRDVCAPVVQGGLGILESMCRQVVGEDGQQQAGDEKGGAAHVSLSL